MIEPTLSTDHDRMRALVVAAVDQQFTGLTAFRTIDLHAISRGCRTADTVPVSALTHHRRNTSPEYYVSSARSGSDPFFR